MSRLGEEIPMKYIVPNSNAEEGEVVIFDYPSGRHFAFKEAMFTDTSVVISECNMEFLYGKGKCGYRVVDSNTDGFVGFYSVD